MGQLSTTTLQLSSAVCCDPAVALPLISSGAHAPALEQLKGAVKSLTGLWAACMDFLQQQDQHTEQQLGLDRSAGQCTATSWQCLTPALASTVKLLLHMSVTSAEFVSSGGSSQQVPKEMCSMSALNLSWANLTRLLVAIPMGLRMQVGEQHPQYFAQPMGGQHLPCVQLLNRTPSLRAKPPLARQPLQTRCMAVCFAAGAGGPGLHAWAAVRTAAAAHRHHGPAGATKGEVSRHRLCCAAAGRCDWQPLQAYSCHESPMSVLTDGCSSLHTHMQQLTRT